MFLIFQYTYLSIQNTYFHIYHIINWSYDFHVRVCLCVCVCVCVCGIIKKLPMTKFLSLFQRNVFILIDDFFLTPSCV